MAITEEDILSEYETDEITAGELLEHAGTHGFLQLTNPERGRNLYRDNSIYLRETAIDEHTTEEQYRRPTIPDGPAGYPVSFTWMENLRDKGYRLQQEGYDTIYDELEDADTDDILDGMEDTALQGSKDLLYGIGASIVGGVAGISLFSGLETELSVPLILTSCLGPVYLLGQYQDTKFQRMIGRNEARKDRYDEKMAAQLLTDLDDTPIYTIDDDGFKMLSFTDDNEEQDLDLDHTYWQFTR